MPEDARLATRAEGLFKAAHVWDMTLPWTSIEAVEAAQLPKTLRRFRDAGINLVSLTVDEWENPFPKTVLHLARMRAEVERSPDVAMLARTVAEIDEAKRQGKIAVVFNLQETNPLDGWVELIGAFYELGVRHMVLAYNRKNRVGDGCTERTDAGLSRLGIEVIREMNRVGMLVDGSHAGYRTTMEAMEVTTQPFLFSHSNARAVFDHYRNIRDDQIEACARTGGVVGVNGLGAFLDDVEASTASMFKHIDHIASLVGPRHVGIGLDYCEDTVSFWRWVRANPGAWPLNNGKPHVDTKFARPEQVRELVDLMLARGYGDDDVTGILGGNFRRVCREVWK